MLPILGVAGSSSVFRGTHRAGFFELCCKAGSPGERSASRYSRHKWSITLRSKREMRPGHFCFLRWAWTLPKHLLGAIFIRGKKVFAIDLFGCSTRSKIGIKTILLFWSGTLFLSTMKFGRPAPGLQIRCTCESLPHTSTAGSFSAVWTPIFARKY